MSARLSADLVSAEGERQSELIDTFKMHKGGEYTEALVEAIHKLDGATREKVRDALAERLTRMTAATLRARLKDADREMRSAAALACGMKEDKSLVPDLINLLTDPDERVSQAARVALESLTEKKNLGPRAGATPEQRAEAARRWRAWWLKQQGE
ncbi:MAG TPA: HEAT repeat domain-containing protein [Gemmataceae bacterium]|nr:HEAT repeat domain-containing protein [Gemmataceae bacterium]